ncbi:MAG: hypothetical protein Q9223_006643 [Gallowayella weberi]
MASASVPRALTNTIHQVCRARPRIYAEAFKRAASSKHPTGFSPPSPDELTELRERVQDFTRREIPKELAAKTDKDNEFPNEMWKKFGDAGYEVHSHLGQWFNLTEEPAFWVSRRMKNMAG